MGVPGKWGSCGGKVLPHGFETMNRDRSVWPSGTLITSCGVKRLFPFFLLHFRIFPYLLSPPSSLPPSPSPHPLPPAQGLVSEGPIRAWSSGRPPLELGRPPLRVSHAEALSALTGRLQSILTLILRERPPGPAPILSATGPARPRSLSSDLHSVQPWWEDRPRRTETGPTATTLKQEVRWDGQGPVVAGGGAGARLPEGTSGQWKSPGSSVHRPASSPSSATVRPWAAPPP